MCELTKGYENNFQKMYTAKVRLLILGETFVVNNILRFIKINNKKRNKQMHLEMVIFRNRYKKYEKKYKTSMEIGMKISMKTSETN